MSDKGEIIQKLDVFIRKYYFNQLLRGLVYFMLVFIVFGLIASTAEYVGNFSTTIRTILFYAFVATNVGVLFKFVVLPLAAIYKLGKTLTYTEAAQIVGKHFAEVNDKLLNLLQLESQLNQSEQNRQLQLLEAGIRQKTVELNPIPFAAAINLGENKKFLPYLVFVLAVSVGIYVFWPCIIFSGTQRIINHSTYYEPPAPFSFSIKNSTLNCVKHEDFLLEVQIDGNEIPNEVYLETSGVKYKLTKKSIDNFSHLFRNVQKSTQFQLIADGHYSKVFELNALPNPLLLQFEIKLEYPAYTGRQNEIVGNTGDITVPAGTKASWKFKTRDARSLKLAFSDTSIALQSAKENQFEWKQRLTKNSVYSVYAYNEYFRSRDSIRYYINVIPDQFPTIQVKEQQDSLNSKRIYFGGEIADDYGFKKLVFTYAFIGKKDSVGKEINHAFTKEVPIAPKANRDVFYHEWNLNELTLSPGDQLEYFFEIFDNDGVNGSKSTKSERLFYKVPTLNELAEKSEKRADEIKKDLKSSIDLANQMKKKIADLELKMAEKKSLSWEDRKNLRELTEMQKELEKKADEIKKENQMRNTEQSAFKEQEQEILEKQQQIQKLFDEILNDEMKKLIEEMRRLADELDKDKAKDMLDKMKLSTEDVSKELDRTLELFKRLEFEQKMNDMISELKELAEKQETLKNQTEQKSSEEKSLKEQQEQLNKQFEDLKKDLEELQEKNKELGNEMNLSEPQKQSENIEKKMQESADKLEEKKKKQAAESQQQAADEMKSMAEKMQSMMDQMAQEGQEEDLKALREILENLLSLSFDQEKLINVTKLTSINDPNYTKLARQQQKLKEDSKTIEDSLLALSKRVPALVSTVNKEIGSIKDNMNRSTSYLADRNVMAAAGRQQFAMTSINNLALLLSEIEQQMSQSQSQSSGKGSCKKPGKGQPKPSAANMRSMQEQLSKQLEQMKEQMQKNGQKPGDKKGQGRGGQMSEQLAKMAAQQEAIRQMLGDMMKKQAGKDGKIDGGQQGNLGKMKEMMEQTETDIVNRSITNETMKRQQEILTRLLEAENAERERDQEEKRESNEAKFQEISNPALIMEYKHRKQAENELLKTIPLSMKPFYRDKVSKYFNSIND